MQTTDEVLKLVAAMERAKVAQLTDSEQARKTAAFDLLNQLHNLCVSHHAVTTFEVRNGTKLRTDDITWALASLAAYYISSFAPNALAQVLAVGAHASLILSIINEQGKENKK